jgi:hypothetical protein
VWQNRRFSGPNLCQETNQQVASYADLCRRVQTAGGQTSYQLSEPIPTAEMTEARQGTFLETRTMKDFRVERKICEGCGALWLRSAGHGIYCHGCALRLSDFPAPLMHFRRGRKRRTLKVVAGAGGGR